MGGLSLPRDSKNKFNVFLKQCKHKYTQSKTSVFITVLETLSHQYNLTTDSVSA